MARVNKPPEWIVWGATVALCCLVGGALVVLASVAASMVEGMR